MLRPQIYGVRLFYQTRATSGTQQLEMRPTGQTDFEGQVPSTFITGDRLQYYIILYDRSNSPISTYKNNTSPEVLRIVGGRYSNLQGGLLGGNQGSSDASYLSVGFLLGTGVGQITDQATLQNQKGQKVQEGFALAPFHLQLEMDFWFSKNWAVGLFSRLQIIEFSPLGGVHLKWRFVNDQDQKWSLRGGGGYGKVRHLVSLNYQDPTTQMTRKVLDTTLEGPVFYKLGVGYLYQLTSSFSFSMALDFTHLIALNVDDGDSPSLHFDLHFGVVASF